MASRSELAPHALKKIAKELHSLEHAPPEDIQVLNSEHDLTEIQAWIRGPDGTPYENGYFKVRLLLGDGYPETPPKGYFVTKIFHPNVSSTGEICVNTLKKDWKPDLGIKHVLLTVKCLLIVPNPESALNEEAGKLLLEQYEDYAKKARLYTAIHAKSGKSEFNALAAERSKSTKQQSSQNENPTTSNNNDTPSQTDSAKEKDNQPAVAQGNNNTVNVLTTSVVSNSATLVGGVKRSAPDTPNEKSDNVDKQVRPDVAVKKVATPNADKKKRLRRL